MTLSSLGLTLYSLGHDSRPHWGLTLSSLGLGLSSLGLILSSLGSDSDLIKV